MSTHEDTVVLAKADTTVIPGSRPLRVALYSHDTMGVGHMRRNLLIAETLSGSVQRPAVLMIAGASALTSFAMPPGVDCVVLPSLYKEEDGGYRPRSLGIALEALVELRGQVVRAALAAFRPDVFIADKEPRGALGELDRSLAELRDRGRTRCVLGLRDVLDAPKTVRRQWRDAGNDHAIRDYYNRVWVYGDPAVYDPVREYRFSAEVTAKVRYAGYLNRQQQATLGPEDRSARALVGERPGRIVLGMVGGGQDGTVLAEAFAGVDWPQETTGVLLTGPFMPLEVQRRLRQRAACQPRLRVLDFVTDPEVLLSLADRVIAMGGYNTILEVLSFEKHALIIPRVRPRREQLIRALRLRDLGLLDVLRPAGVSSAALAAWLARDLGPPPRAKDRIDLNGTIRLPLLLQELLKTAPATPVARGQPLSVGNGQRAGH